MIVTDSTSGTGSFPVHSRDPWLVSFDNLLDDDECARLRAASERLGYVVDAPVAKVDPPPSPSQRKFF